MKYFKSIIFLLICLAVNLDILANPIQESYFKELTFDDGNWYLEMYYSPYQYLGPRSLDGMFIRSTTDTAYFSAGFVIDSFSRVFTNGHMEETLYINPAGDEISMGYSPFAITEYLYFGNTDGSAHINAPVSSQSICIRDTYINNQQSIMYYLDNSPTLGAKNDSLNATGNLTILFTDLDDNPLRNFKICYTPRGNNDSLTDENGLLTIHNYARRVYFYNDEHDPTYMTWKQILPELTTYDTIRIDTSESGIDEKKIKDEYLLNQNYPNPFKSTTNIIFYVPENGHININLYDIAGKKIKNLYSGYKERGAHTLELNADKIPSGSYIYRLESPAAVLSKKCTIIN
jgi:hypothetical protein